MARPAQNPRFRPDPEDVTVEVVPARPTMYAVAYWMRPRKHMPGYWMLGFASDRREHCVRFVELNQHAHIVEIAAATAEEVEAAVRAGRRY